MPVRRANPAGESHVCSDAGHTDDAGIPANAGLHQEAVFLRDIAQDFAELDPQALSGEAHGFGQQGFKGRTLQCHDAQFRQYFLLADTLLKGAGRFKSCGFSSGFSSTTASLSSDAAILANTFPCFLREDVR